MDRIRKEHIRRTEQVEYSGDKGREVRLKCFGHVQRRDGEYISRRLLTIKLLGRRKRRKPKRRFMDVV